VSKKVKCVKDAYRDDVLVFKKGKEYLVTVEGKKQKTVNEIGDTEIYDPDNSQQKEIFKEYFKEI